MIRKMMMVFLSLICSANVASALDTYILDTFKGSGVSTTLQNHVGDTGARWALVGRNIAYIDGPNTAVYSKTDANYYNTASIPVNDFSVVATVHMTKPNTTYGGNCYVSGRTNPSTHARYVAGHTQGLGWGIYYMDGMGHETRLAPLVAPRTLPVNSTYLLELRIVGSSIRMYLNNQLIASATNTYLTTGNHAGLEMTGSGYGSTSSYEIYDFKVTSPSVR